MYISYLMEITSPRQEEISGNGYRQWDLTKLLKSLLFFGMIEKNNYEENVVLL